VRYWSKIADLNLLLFYLGPLLGVSPLEFWRWQTRVPGLWYGIVCMMLGSAILVELRVVTDGQMDKHTMTAYTALA